MTAYATPAADATAVMGRRIASYVIDGLLGAIVVLAVAYPTFTSRAEKLDTGGSATFCDRYNDDRVVRCIPVGDTAYVLSEDEQGGLLAAVYGASAAWLVVNAVVVQGLAGGSLGKLMLGLRVVRRDGRRAGLGWCALRTLILPVDSFLCGVIGLVSSLSTAGHRRLGDMAASTLVVGRQYEGQPPPVPRLDGGLTRQPSFALPVGSGAGGDGPTWDPAREAYIQYDRQRSEWVQWSETAREWRPIDQ